MVTLVTLEETRADLRLDDTYDDADVLRKMEEATDGIISYLKITDLQWDVTTTPPRVKTAIKLYVRALFDGAPQPISSAVQSILWRDRDPALA